MEMTKEALETLIEEKAQVATAAHGKEWNESIAGAVKEQIDESLKEFEKKIPTFEEVAPREDPSGGFASMAEFAKGVYDCGENLAGINSPRTVEGKKLQVWAEKADSIQTEINKAAGTPSQNLSSLQAGGALVPPEFSRTALSRARDRSNILSLARTVPMATDVLSIPFINGFNESQGLVAGNVKFRMVSENASATGNDVEFENVTLTLREANALIYVSNKLMEFSPISIEPFLTTALDDALDLFLSNSFVNGTGAGEPLGVLNSDALVSVAKESGQPATTLINENILQMLAQAWGRGTWYANRNTIPQLGVLQVAVGTGGSAIFASNATGSFPATLYGMGLDYQDVMPTLGTVGDILLADWSQYLVGQRSGGAGLQMSESMHLKFDYRQTAFQATFYVDGQPWWPEEFQPLNGDPRSPFVTTATRA